MAAVPLLLLLCSPSSMHHHHSQLYDPMLPLLFFIVFTLLSFSLLFSLYKRLEEREEAEQQTQKKPTRNALSIFPLPETRAKTHKTHVPNLNHLAHSLLLVISPSNSSKWARALFNGEVCEKPSSRLSGERDDFDGVVECGNSEDDQDGRRKKKKTKKKKQNLQILHVQDMKDCVIRDKGENLIPEEKGLCPFTTSSSATQRRIKQQYDQLMKCHGSKGLTLAQVEQFTNCLVEARKELLHKFAAIRRKFTITKALLLRAERSSFDRLRQQIYRLETEQKRLEEDSLVYNWLQEQLRLSPAYKKMLEVGARVELKAKKKDLMASTDGLSDISFEEFLAKEKKDSFWQKQGKLRSHST